MDALLRWVEVDEAVDLRRDEGVLPAMLHADGLLHARHARAGKADADIGKRRLKVDCGGYSLVHAANVSV